MTHITIERNRMWDNYSPYAEIQNVESPLPKPTAIEHCPHCRGARNSSGEHSILRVKTAIKQFLSGVFGLIFLVLRLTRLLVGFALSVAGVVGGGLHAVSLKIVHPDDRRLLPGTTSRDNIPRSGT